MTSQSQGDRFMAAFEEAPVGMALVALGHGLQGRCMTANSMLAGMLAMPAEQLTSVPMTDVVAPGDHAAWEAVLEQLAGGESSARAELRLRARGGKEIDALLSLTAARDNTGRWRCAIVQVLPA